MRYEPTTTDFCSEDLSDWAIRPWVQLTLIANFVQLLQFCFSVQYSHFIVTVAFINRHSFFKLNLAQVITLAVKWLIHMVFITEEICRRSYKKLVWVGFEPRTATFRSDALTNWAIKAMNSTRSQSQLCTAIPISSSVQCSHFILPIAFVSRHIWFKWNLAQVILLSVEWLMHMVFITEGFLEVAIVNWPELDLNPQTINCTQTL